MRHFLLLVPLFAALTYGVHPTGAAPAVTRTNASKSSVPHYSAATLEMLYMRILDRASPGQLAQVRQMLDSGVPVNVRFDAGGHDTPLTHAAGFGQLEIVRLLLQRGANPNAQDDEGKTALWNAADAPLSESGSYANHQMQPVTAAERKVWTAAYVGMIRALLAHKANPNLANHSGVTPLGIAAFRGRSEEVAALLQGGADPNRQDFFGKTPLEWAAYNGNTAVVHLFQEHGAHLGTGRALPKPGQRALDAALLEAASRTNLAAVKVWLSRGADPSALSSHEWQPTPEMRNLATPLLDANTSPSITRLLLRAGADPNGTDETGADPLMSASIQVMPLLLARGAKVNVCDHNGFTPLINAASDAAKLRLLLLQGADIKARDNEGLTALLHCQNEKALEVLLAHGARINEADVGGNTALINAAQQDYGEGGVTCDPKWAQVLLRHGADPNHRNVEGRTALMILSAPFGEGSSDTDYSEPEARVSFARLLLARGARTDLRNEKGQTALDIARRSRAKQLVNLLNAPARKHSRYYYLGRRRI